MSFTVTWLPAAVDQLAAIWAAASDQIDRRLAADPRNEGESREANERIAFEPPLRVMFRVYEAKRAVVVGSVGVFGRRG